MKNDNYILLIETSTEICSIGLANNDSLIYNVDEVKVNSHSEKITIIINDVLIKGKINIKDLSAVCLSSGPGSYTSLRVGTSTAKGICYSLGIPLIALDSLDILVQGFNNLTIPKDDVILSMIDARRMEAYISSYSPDLKKLTDCAPIIIDDKFYTELTSKYENLHLCGTGAEKFYECYKNDNKCYLHHTETSSKYMVDLAYTKLVQGSFEDTAYFEPNYLKSPNITLSQKNIFNI